MTAQPVRAILCKLLPIVVARGEWIGACVATGAMTGMVVELMQIENRARARRWGTPHQRTSDR